MAWNDSAKTFLYRHWVLSILVILKLVIYLSVIPPEIFWPAALVSHLIPIVIHLISWPPFIICGDFNETPYSHTYFELKEHFQNAFEEAGNGFGFTSTKCPFS